MPSRNKPAEEAVSKITNMDWLPSLHRSHGLKPWCLVTPPLSSESIEGKFACQNKNEATPYDAADPVHHDVKCNVHTSKTIIHSSKKSKNNSILITSD